MFRKLIFACAVIFAGLLAAPTESMAFHGGFHGGGFHGGGYRGGFHGGYAGRGAYGGGYRRGVYAGGYRRGVYGGVYRRGYYGGAGRYWGGRYWAYGVGPCWRRNPFGQWIWVCY